MLGEEHALFQPGPVRTTDGEIKGEHPGLVHYTVGQRRKVGVTHTEPLHVTRLEPQTNTLVVGTADDLLCESLEAEDLNLFVSPQHLCAGPVEVKIRYRHEPAPARIEWLDEGRVRVRFDDPQRSVAPGQSCVIYRDRLVLAGGRICPPRS